MENSAEWITHITHQLFLAEDRRIQELMFNLIEQSNLKKGTFYPGFVIRGDKFVPLRYRETYRAFKGSLPSLHISLIKESDSFKLDYDQLVLDKAQIRQMLHKLIGPAKTPQQFRDALPEALVAFIGSHMQTLGRMDSCPPEWIRNDPRSLKQFEKILTKIEFYSVSRLLY